MPYLVYVPNYDAPYVLEDCDSSYLRYFHLWSWRVDTTGPQTSKIPGETLLQPFKRQDIYMIWRKEVKHRQQEEQRKVSGLRAIVETKQKQDNGGESGKKEFKNWFAAMFRRKEKNESESESEVKVNHLVDLQRRWS